MKKVFLLCFLSLLSTTMYAARLEKIDFSPKGEFSEIEFVFDSAKVDVKKFQDKDFKQIIIDIKNTTSSKKIMNGFDTSEFSGSVVYVSGYKKPDNPKDLRVVLQLRENVRSVLQRRGQSVVLKVEKSYGSFAASKVNDQASYEEKVAAKTEVSTKLLIPKSEKIEDILENITLSGQKKYIGKRTTINVKQTRIADILKMIADASGFNIILTEEVEKLPVLSLNLVNIPWDQALDTIIDLGKLVATKNGAILMVTTLDQATKELKKKISAKKIKIKEEPLMTNIFPISYSDPKKLEGIIKPYLTKNRGSTSVDLRTNSLIIKDTNEALEKIKKIIKILDTQTPQVIVETKIVEVRDENLKRIGLEDGGFKFGYDPVSSTTEQVEGSLIGGENVGPGFSFSSATSSTAASPIGLTIGRFGRLFNLNFKLELMENEKKVKLVSSPKIITQNKKKAVIKSVETRNFTVDSGDPDNNLPTVQQFEAALNLEVLPQVTNEGSISLEITVDKEDFLQNLGNAPDKSSNKLTTNVLVENGETIVLGGVYKYSKESGHSGIPFLKDIPLIGWLFSSGHSNSLNKSELIIFMTPRILNEKKAGLVTDESEV